MIELSNEDKIRFIRSQGINYLPNSNFSLDKLYEFSLIQDLIKSKIHCFGYADEEDKTCKSCFLLKEGICQSFKQYLKETKQTVNNSIIKIQGPKGDFMEDVNELLKRMNLREAANSYKIIKIILESDGKPFSSVFSQIQEVLSGKSLLNVRTRFYQANKLINKKLGLKVTTVTQKFLKISKEK